VTDKSIDHRLIERAIGLIGVHIRDSQIRRDQLDRAYAVCDLDGQHRRLVESGLASTGVKVLPDGPTLARAPTDLKVRLSGATSGGEVRARDTPSALVTVAVSEPGDPIRAARLVLHQDRGRRNVSVRILTAIEEVGLAQLLRAGQSISEPLPSGYRKTLDNTSEAARAFDAMLLHNTKLVWSIARQYLSRGMEPDDIFQNGFIGLIRSVEMFDCASGNKLSTYATWWIRQAITRGIANDSRLIRVPVHMHEKMMSVDRAYQRLAMTQARVDVRDVADHMNISVAEVIQCLRLSRGIVSLDLPVGDDRGTTLGDLIEDEDGADSYEVVLIGLLQDQCQAVFQTLAEREAGVIKLRFGLVDGQPHTLDEIGQVYGVTRERIRQIEAKSLKKLRHPSRSHALRQYLD
jgi:RNA polymerase primary sigma factor